MKATLIKLDTKVVDMPEYRPFYREIVRDGLEPLTANYEGMPLTSIPVDYKTVDYRVVRIKGGENGENGDYLINDDMWYTAIPLLEDIVQIRLRPLEKENIDLKVEVAWKSDVIKKLNNSWWERLKRFTKKLPSPLPIK